MYHNLIKCLAVGLLLFSTVVSQGQHLPSVEWAPIGATWNYLHGGPTFVLELIQLQSVKDTIIQGMTVRKITQTLFHDFDGATEDLGDIFLLQDSNKVYYLIQDSFHLLYDFDAKVGDTIRILNHPRLYYPPEKPSWTFAIVESVSTIELNGEIRRTQELSPNIDFMSETSHFGQMVIEGIGSRYYLIPYFYHAECDHLCPLLNCYSDSSLFFHNTTYPCDTISPEIIAVHDLHAPTGLTISPNPVKNRQIHVFFEGGSPDEPIYYAVYDCNGRRISSETRMSGHEIDISYLNLQAGLYFISLRSRSWRVIRKIIVVE
jgi:hypothetical protein